MSQLSQTAPDHSIVRKIPLLILIAVFAFAVEERIRQPGDLHDNDQSKTMAYVVDMIRNGRWAGPRDAYLAPATKPPMYSWLAAPAIAVSGRFEPLLFKLPSLVAGGITCVLIVVACSKLVGIEAGAAAGCIFLATQTSLKLLYQARPDMVMTAFLTGAWISGTLALSRQSASTRRLAAIFWICVCGAALSKGPPALLPLIYVIAAAPLIGGGWRSLKRLHWMMAIGLLVVPLLVWMGLGAMQTGSRFFQVYFGQEMLTRVVGAGPESAEGKAPWLMVVWFFNRFQPWSLLVLVALLGLPIRRWAKHELAPVILWLLIGLIFFSIPGGKRMDYLLPVYVPGAILAACVLFKGGQWLGLTPTRATLIAAAIAAVFALRPETRRIVTSDPMEQFARDIQPVVRDEPMLMMVGGYQPLLPLMGRFEGTVRDEKTLRATDWKWAVMQADSRWDAKLECEGVPVGRNNTPVKIGLYHIGGERSPTIEDIAARVK